MKNRSIDKKINLQILRLQILILSAIYRYRTKYRPFLSLAERIGKKDFETENTPLDEKQQKLIRIIESETEAVCSHTIWESKCMVKALCAKHIINEYGIPCTLYFGLRKSPDKRGMSAHAWLRCGDTLITGGESAEMFTVTAMFGDDFE